MAKLQGWSLRTLERVFITQFQKTPLRFARELRCQRAVSMVRDGNRNKEIVAALGFASEGHLCHDFNLILGRSPQSYRRNSRA
jgi:transcriptional regulator GlxA family with amidase domain